MHGHWTVTPVNLPPPHGLGLCQLILIEMSSVLLYQYIGLSISACCPIEKVHMKNYIYIFRLSGGWGLTSPPRPEAPTRSLGGWYVLYTLTNIFFLNLKPKVVQLCYFSKG